MAIFIDILTRSDQAKRDLAGLGKIFEKTQKLFAGMGSGRSNPAANLQQMTKGMQALSKAAEQAEQRWKLTSRTLDDVSRKIKGLENGGSVLLSNRDQYKALLDQERSLTRQARTWQTIASNRQAMADNARDEPQPPPGRGGLGSLFRAVGGGVLSKATGGLGSSAAGSVMGTGGVAAIGEALGPVLGALAVAAVGVGIKGFQAALKQDESMVKFLPRMYPGSMGHVVPSVLAQRMGDAGRPMAFNREESIGTFEAMSEGGSGFGSRKLDRDATAAMQMARLFGVDPGGEATALASAQRSGAFKAGDAKRFASMLAVEIKRAGLGPRFEEAQQATLMLLNKQTQELGSARPGPILALQSAFNKTGIPGLTGMNGASVISRMQDAATNPGSEASQALNFAVFRKMGARSYYDVQRLQEEGLSNPGYLHSLFSLVERSAPNAHAADMALKEHFGGALSLHELAALRAKAPGHRLANLQTGSLAGIGKLLGGGGSLLDKGAASTTNAFPSLQIKRAEILAHEVILRTGQPILNKVAAGARKVADAGEPHLADGGQSLLDGWTGFTGKWTPIGQAARIAGMLAGAGRLSPVGPKWHKGQFGPDGTPVLPPVGPFGPGGSPLSLVKGAREFLGIPYVYGGTDPATGLDCSGSMQQVFRPFGVNLPRLAHNQGQVGQRIKKNDLQPGDLMFFNTNQGADHHVGMYAGNGKVIHESSSAGRMVEVPFTGWLANHFSHGQRVQVEVTVNHPAFKAHIKETMHEIHHENTRAHPNTRNAR
jgi:lysozyme family protein